MRSSAVRRQILVASVFMTILIGSGMAASAQNTATSGSDRLLLSFAEDAAVVGNQWWEGMLEITDQDPIDVKAVHLVFALQPIDRVEIGGKVGFGSTDTPAGVYDGSGATDLNLWGKYYLGTLGDDTEFAVGGTVTVPTGDDAAGLGNDSFGASAFWSFRQAFPKAFISGHAGARFNEDGRTMGYDMDGKLSAVAGLGIVYPLSDQISVIGEVRFESERFEGSDSDLRLLAGGTWRLTNRGMIRGGLVFGLTDGAPDAQLVAGYAVNF